MQFVNPLFLYGLFAVAIPVIIHLFNFRWYRKIYFSNVRFLEEIREKTKRQSQLQHLLVLLARILTIIAIVFAFARPYIPHANAEKIAGVKRLVSIYVDNSYSMQAESDKGSMLDKARALASEIAASYPEYSTFQLISNDFSVGEELILNREEVMGAIEEINYSPDYRPVHEVINRQKELSDDELSIRDLYLISDFQQSNFKEIKPELDSSYSLQLLPIEVLNSNNLFIDSCWFETPIHRIGQQNKLWIRIVNSSTRSLEKIPVKLIINDEQRAMGSFSVGAHAVVSIPLNYIQQESGIQSGVIQLVDFPVTYDDDFYFTYRVRKSIDVLVVNQHQENKYLKSLLAEDSTLHYHQTLAGRVDYSNLSQYDAIIFEGLNSISSGMGQSLKQYISNGGKLLIFPPEKQMDFGAYNEFLSAVNAAQYADINTNVSKIAFIDMASVFFKGVFEEKPEKMDLPVVNFSYKLEIDGVNAGFPLLKLEDGADFLYVSEFQSGQLFSFASPLSETASNFPRHSLFVPTMYNICIASSLVDPLYFLIGEKGLSRCTVTQDAEAIYKVKKLKNDFEFIPAIRKNGGIIQVMTGEQISDAGNYLLNHGGEDLKGLAYNFNRDESYLTYFSFAELREKLLHLELGSANILEKPDTRLSEMVRQKVEGRPLWRWFIVIALFFLAVEIVLIRYFRNRSTGNKKFQNEKID